jgi:hypothetical protein
MTRITTTYAVTITEDAPGTFGADEQADDERNLVDVILDSLGYPETVTVAAQRLIGPIPVDASPAVVAVPHALLVEVCTLALDRITDCEGEFAHDAASDAKYAAQEALVESLLALVTPAAGPPPR